ncbi:hypothetical protein CDV31_010739 [Fusarium ambrosium]|uniref:Uncharacterized protein n=1 Tax=Fusarium ambrosium TaxID=131363 RepID=A0A428TLA8_9HYPO|nr:hypothetical protein CDV31_010739 [Fusarium ambrosium]
MPVMYSSKRCLFRGVAEGFQYLRPIRRLQLEGKYEGEGTPYDDGKWHEGKYEGGDTGYDDGKYHGGKKN